MRIVGGTFKGRKLSPPTNMDVRPTSDRVRESLFSILESRFPGHLRDASVLDLFSGTGALGFEALSRGAEHCHFVEKAPKSIALIRKNAEALKVQDQIEIMRSDASRLEKLAGSKTYDIIFADPPYQKNLAEKSLLELLKHKLLRPHAIIMVEEHASVNLPIIDQLSLETDRTYGDTRISFFSYMP